MEYNVSFKRQVEGFRAYEYVGDDFVVIDTVAGKVIEDVTGVTLSVWDGVDCKSLIPPLKRGVKMLVDDEKYYRRWLKRSPVELEDVISFLNRIRSNCEQYPDAIIDVMVD